MSTYNYFCVYRITISRRYHTRRSNCNDIFGIALTPLLKHFETPEKDPKMFFFADDLASTKRLSRLLSWWKDLLDVGPKYGYFPKSNKTVLIVQSEYESNTGEICDNTNIKITSSQQRHSGAIIGSELSKKIHQGNNQKMEG